MGCNYYLHSKQCETCGQCSQVHHIGKQSFGWSFLFSANVYPLWDFKRWKEAINDPRKVIRDEYGGIQNKTEFFEHIEKVKTQHQRELHDENYYYDDEGYRFCRREFS